MNGVPLHPQLVHFPIVLITISFVFDLVGTIRNSKNWINFGGILMIIAIVSAFAALQSGEMAEDLIRPMSDSLHEAVEEHEEMATTTFFLVLFMGIARGWLQIKGFFTGWKRWVYVGLAGIAMAMILRVGHLGGKLVYLHGAGVTKSTNSQLE